MPYDIGEDFNPLTIPAVMPKTVRRVAEDGTPTQFLLEYEQAQQTWMRDNTANTNRRLSLVKDAADGLEASVTEETNARIEGDEALAEYDLTLLSRVDDISANAGIKMATKAAPTGAASSIGIYTTAGGDNFAGIEMLAGTGVGSAIGFTADKFLFIDSGTAEQVLTYSAGEFTFNANVKFNGDVNINPGTTTALSIASGFSNRGSINGTASSVTGSTGWVDLGPSMTLDITADGGFAFPIMWIRDTAVASNLGGSSATAQVSIRLLINGTNYYEREIFNLSIPAGGSRDGGVTDFFDAVVPGSSLTFQLQYNVNYATGVTGAVFAKVMAFMSSR